MTMPVAIACSHCHVRLKLADTLLGKNVKCPKCGQVFKAQTEKAAPTPIATSIVASSGPPPAPALKLRRSDEETDSGSRPRSRSRRDDEDDGERRPRSKRSRKPASNQTLYALLAGGGVFVVGI